MGPFLDLNGIIAVFSSLATTVILSGVLLVNGLILFYGAPDQQARSGDHAIAVLPGLSVSLGLLLCTLNVHGGQETLAMRRWMDKVALPVAVLTLALWPVGVYLFRRTRQ
jgi:hypothetical protein